MWNEQDVALLLHSYYILWLVGMMEPELTAELDAMTPPGAENWRQVMHRKFRVDPRRIRARFLSLCDTMSDDEAVEAILLEFASGDQVSSRRGGSSQRG